MQSRSQRKFKERIAALYPKNGRAPAPLPPSDANAPAVAAAAANIDVVNNGGYPADAGAQAAPGEPPAVNNNLAPAPAASSNDNNGPGISIHSIKLY